MATELEKYNPSYNKPWFSFKTSKKKENKTYFVKHPKQFDHVDLGF